jgi:hypothetical protein
MRSGHLLAMRMMEEEELETWRTSKHRGGEADLTYG